MMVYIHVKQIESHCSRLSKGKFKITLNMIEMMNLHFLFPISKCHFIGPVFSLLSLKM